MDKVTKMWGNLSLTEREVVEHDFKDTNVIKKAAIVARFFMKRRVNLEVVASTLMSAWKTELSFEVCDLGENKAIFLFKEETDMVRVLSNSLWSFDKYLLAVHKLEKKEQIQNISFDKASFWVQIHDLPARRMTREVGERIGRTLGEVKEVDVPTTDNLLGKYIRVHVRIDITQALGRGRLINFGGSTPVWVAFKYERLPIFCYWCGKLNHDDKDCGMWLRSKGSLQAHDQQYGSWLRASPEKLQCPRESSTTMAMDGDSEEAGLKRKLVVPLGEMDLNMAQGKKVKTNFDEIILKNSWDWQRLLCNLAGSNECHELELPRA
ncbi:hypothetical protein SO802_007252 [Lithocarpus litseifolius]|uniref:CCHC-type domain-containing protein n=1 Tax=Lithocarpus litseifolius TaxID=425828 RepID=A0AAW2DRN2_9ROSI